MTSVTLDDVLPSRTHIRVAGRCANTPGRGRHDGGVDMAKRTCAVDGCDRPVKGRGWCSMHYQRWKMHGDPGDAARLISEPNLVCSVDGCTGRASSRGWCEKHYQRWAKHGDPTITKGAWSRGPADRRCAIDGCDGIHLARGYCASHYDSWRAYGDPTERRRSSDPTERFWSKVAKGDHDDCWPWLGSIDSRGYGYISFRGKGSRAHRVAYELQVGPIPEGLEIDHLCRVRECVNPSHLEPVTKSVNMRRAWAAKRRREGRQP